MTKYFLAIVWASTMAGYFWYDPAYYTYISFCYIWGCADGPPPYHCHDCQRQYEGETIEPDEMKRILQEHTYDQDTPGGRRTGIRYGWRMHKRLYWTMPDCAGPIRMEQVLNLYSSKCSRKAL